MYCDKKSERTQIQFIFGVGAAIGKFVFPFLNDLIGRRKSIIISFLSLFAFLLMHTIAIYENNYLGMLIGQFCAGLCGSGMLSSIFIYVCDFCSK